VINVKNSLITLGITAIATLSLVGCSTTTNSAATNNTQATGNTSQPMTVTTDSSLAMLPDSYFAANRTVDRFLNDWLTLDAKDGIALLDSNAKQGKTATQLQQYFTQMPPGHMSYEVVGYKKVSDIEYQFHVWMYGKAMGLYGPKGRPPTNPETLTVVKQNNTWYLNDLPKF
jgi:type IV pilus biogenesis protein CpaD/CtpE